MLRRYIVDEVLSFKCGCVLLLISMLYFGMCLILVVDVGLVEEVWVLIDIDWYIFWFYDFVEELGVSILVVYYLCYVVDFNCFFDDKLLYSIVIIGLYLDILFDGWLFYCEGMVLFVEECMCYLVEVWMFYYWIIVEELVWLKVEFGYVLFWDVYLICFYVLYLFDG